jgi:hypothetical protein
MLAWPLFFNLSVSYRHAAVLLAASSATSMHIIWTRLTVQKIWQPFRGGIYVPLGAGISTFPDIWRHRVCSPRTPIPSSHRNSRLLRQNDCTLGLLFSEFVDNNGGFVREKNMTTPLATPVSSCVKPTLVNGFGSRLRCFEPISRYGSSRYVTCCCATFHVFSIDIADTRTVQCKRSRQGQKKAHRIKHVDTWVHPGRYEMP